MPNATIPFEVSFKYCDKTIINKISISFFLRSVVYIIKCYKIKFKYLNLFLNSFYISQVSNFLLQIMSKYRLLSQIVFTFSYFLQFVNVNEIKNFPIVQCSSIPLHSVSSRRSHTYISIFIGLVQMNSTSRSRVSNSEQLERFVTSKQKMFKPNRYSISTLGFAEIPSVASANSEHCNKKLLQNRITFRCRSAN